MSAEEFIIQKKLLVPVDYMLPLATHNPGNIELHKLLSEYANIKAREAAEKAYNACLESIYQNPTADVEVSKQNYLNTNYPIN